MLDPIPTAAYNNDDNDKRNDEENNRRWAHMIKDYWKAKGYTNVIAAAIYKKQYFMKDDRECRSDNWIVATNLVNCQPPKMQE